ncbi:hypothetical protein JCM10207_006753 [Rhodosporidiobolus poonsookiae]
MRAAAIFLSTFGALSTLSLGAPVPLADPAYYLAPEGALSPASPEPPTPSQTESYDPVAAALSSRLAAISKELGKWPVATPTPTPEPEETTTTTTTTTTSTSTRRTYNPKVVKNPKHNARTPPSPPPSSSSSSASSPSEASSIDPSPPTLPTAAPAVLLARSPLLNPKRPTPSSAAVFVPAPAEPGKILSPFSPAGVDNPKHVYRYPAGVSTAVWTVGGETFEGVSPTHPGQPRSTAVV